MKRVVLVGTLALVGVAYASFEGTVFKAYRDKLSRNQWTVCSGHTGDDIDPNKTYTQAECDELLASDLHKHDADISKCLSPRVQGKERFAATDFALNVGAAKFCASTFAKRLNEGRYREACAEITRWMYTGGRDCRKPESGCSGIVKRRLYERAVCEGKFPMDRPVSEFLETLK